MKVHRPIYYLAFSFLAQVLAVGSGALLIYLMQSYSVYWPSWALLVWGAIVSLLLAIWLDFPLSWKLFNFLLVPSAVGYVSLELPSGFLAIAVVITVLIYLPTLWTGVPYYPTSPKMYQVVCSKLPVDAPFTFIDLGCGFAGLLAYLRRERPNGHYTGVDISPLPFLLSKLRFVLCGAKNVEISYSSFWNLDLSKFDYVYAFLAPPPMARLWAKAQGEMKSGAVFMTNTFVVDHGADTVDEIKDRREYKLYLHRM